MDQRFSHAAEQDAPYRSRRFSRRAILQSALGLAGAGLLAACGGGTTTNTPAPTAAGATPGASSGSPTAVQGKIPSPAEGVPDAYTTAPQLFKSYEGVPGKGGKVNVFTIAYQSPPPPRDQNTYWKELEKKLGVTWEPIITPQPNYGEKSAALIAGGSLPELFYLNPGQNAAPQFRAIDQGAFLDLTPYVTGNALKEYKNLSTFPEYMWKNVSFKGKYYGVPKPIQRNGNVGFYREDWMKKLNLAAPKSADEVRQMLTAFTKNDPDGNGQADTWGLGRYGSNWDGWDDARVANNMFGVPFNWRVNADKTMTHAIETEEFRQAVEYLRRLYSEGLYHPDSGAMTFAQCQTAYLGGKIGLHSEGFGNFVTPKAAGTVYNKITTANPNAVLSPLMPSAVGGAKAVTRNTQGSFGFTGIPSSVKDAEKVKEYLRLLDYLAPPFGSEEWLFLQYGVEGVDFTRDSAGLPVCTDKGTAERGDIVYVMAGLPAFYYPTAPGAAEAAQKLAHEIIKIGIDDPSWPLYSATNVAKAAELNQFGFDRITAIVTGREPLTALDGAIRDWKSRGGDMIRQEFQEVLKSTS